MKNTQKKKIALSYQLLTKDCLRVTALTARSTLHTRFPTLLRHNVTMTSMAAVTRQHFPDSTFVGRWELRDIFFFCVFFIFLSLLILRPSTYCRMVFECLARFKVAFTMLSTAVLVKEKRFAEVAG